jgi:putative serine protease PepD
MPEHEPSDATHPPDAQYGGYPPPPAQSPRSEPAQPAAPDRFAPDQQPPTGHAAAQPSGTVPAPPFGLGAFPQEQAPHAGPDQSSGAAPTQSFGPGPAQQYPPAWSPYEQVPPPASSGPSVPSGRRRTVLLAALVAAVVGGGVGAGTAALVGHDDNNTSAGLSFSTQAAPAVNVDGTVSAAAAKIGPSVVTVNVDTSGEHDTGSGVIIRSDGYILTNNHVISAANGAGRLTATLADGRQVKATVVGADPSDDLAVIKVGLTNLTAATFSSSSKLVVGQTVVAVGAPLGLSDTVTAGIVSNIARPVQTGDASNDAQAVFNAVQTDAAINPGNSGGPLVNLTGDVVGINAAIATDQSSGGLQVPGQQGQTGNIGIGFAIPSDEAARIAAELIKTGKATHAVMGISVADPAANTTAGATVQSVTAGSPAADAGITKGDVVTKLAGQRIGNADALVAAVRSHAPGETVSVTYLHGTTAHNATLHLGSSSK